MIEEPKKVRKKYPKNNLLTFVTGLWVGVLLGALILAGLAWSGIISFDLKPSNTSNALEIDPSAAGKIDEAADDFVLQDVSGNPVRLSELRGKAVVLNFWATWCGPCVEEMPMFQAYNQKYASDLVVLGINMQESADVVKSFVADKGFTYEILMDPKGQVGQSYGVYMLPNTLFIDKDGIVRFHQVGIMNEEQFDGYLKQLGIEL
jgi:cytochrome c biogenesis protein CcmG, thiol:disulfide interchange protein DsbE